MADQRGAQGGFARAFFPGLVLGLILGAFGGVFLSPYLNNTPIIQRPGTSSRTVPPGPRDEGGPAPIPTPEEGGTPQAPGETPPGAAPKPAPSERQPESPAQGTPK